MKLSLPKTYNRKIVQAIAEFTLIEDGDNILVALSGGKDSSFLLFALAVLKKHMAVNFKLSAITIDLGFNKSDYTYLKNLCCRLDIPYHIEKTRIAEYILNVKDGAPCAKCAHFRRGAMVNYMKEHGFNKIAFGHHYDDAVETFLMSIIYSGQILTFQPRRHLSDSDVYIIRPMIYLREKQLIEGKGLIDYREQSNPCPFDNKSKRAEIKRQLKEFTDDKQIFYNLASAMRRGVPLELWPEEPGKKELSRRMKALWNKK